MLLYVVLLYYIYTLLYIGKRKRQTEERANWKKTGRRMPPTSSPVPRLSSVPSAASIVHTIASRSQLRPLVPALMERDGRPPRPLLGDVIATPRNHLATDRPANSNDRAAPLAVGHPARLASSFPSFKWRRYGRAKEQAEGKEEREPVRRMPLTSSPVPLLSVALTVHALARSSLPSSSAVPVILRPDLVRSLSSVRPSVFLFLVPRSPSCRLNAKPSPAAHHLTRSHPLQSGEGSPRPVLVVIPSQPSRHRPATGTGGPLHDLLPASPSPSGRW